MTARDLRALDAIARERIARHVLGLPITPSACGVLVYAEGDVEILTDRREWARLLAHDEGAREHARSVSTGALALPVIVEITDGGPYVVLGLRLAPSSEGGDA